MVSDHDPQAAPGQLEDVRELLNTWAIPNDTRQATDRFDAYRREHQLGPSGGATLRELRDDLRTVVEGTADADEVLTGWVERLGIHVVVDRGAVRFRQPGKAGTAGETLVAVLDAVAAGTWPRLKACPDCHWSFYDHTRSGTKRWCFMNTTGPNVRGCGNIAKARRRRARERTPTRPT